MLHLIHVRAICSNVSFCLYSCWSCCSSFRSWIVALWCWHTQASIQCTILAMQMEAVYLWRQVHCHQVGHCCSTEGGCGSRCWQGWPGLDWSGGWPRGLHQSEHSYMHLVSWFQLAFWWYTVQVYARFVYWCPNSPSCLMVAYLLCWAHLLVGFANSLWYTWLVPVAILLLVH